MPDPSWPRYSPPLPRLIGLVLLSSVVPITLPAQQAPVSCGLLQVTELESAIGGKASGPPKGSRETAADMTIDECAGLAQKADSRL